MYLSSICVSSTDPAIAPECGQEGGHFLRQLQDHNHNPLATQRQRRASLQRLRIVLQAAQCKYLIDMQKNNSSLVP